MTTVTICFVIPQNQNKKIRTKIISTKSYDDFNVDQSMLPAQATFNFNVARAGNTAYL